MVAQVKQLAAGLDPAELDDAAIDNMLGMVGVDGGDLPGRMAEINQIMDALPPEVVDRLLTSFYNDWNRFKG